MSICFVNHQTREIVYADQVGDHVHAEWQQWINERNAVGRVCVGRDLGRRLSFDWLRGRYTPGLGWQEVTREQATEIGVQFQREGLEFPWKPSRPFTTSDPC